MAEWNYRPGKDPQEQLRELGETIGIQNLKDVKVEEDSNGDTYLYIYTKEKQFKVQMTEV